MMRRFYLALIFALAVCAGAAAKGWDDVYAARLNASAAWLESKLSLKTAELAYGQYLKPLAPTISLATGTSTAFSIGSAGFTAGSIIPSITLENLYGADLALKAPLVPNGSGGIGLGDPSLSLTRKLFVETEADRMDAEAAVLSARAAIRSIETTLRATLAADVLNARYYRDLLEADNGNLKVLEKVRTATVDTTELRALDRKILAMRKSILVAKGSLADLDDEVKANADVLYGDLLRLQAEWTAGTENQAPGDSIAIRALELSLQAAEKRFAFSLLPYLPNPSLTASLYYDVSAASVAWGLSMSLSFDALDKGQHDLSALKRREYPRIIGIKLSDARSSLADNIRRTNDKLMSLELDKKIKELDILDAQDVLRIVEELYRGGFTTEENLVTRRIDLSVEQLLAQKIDYDVMIQKLNLASYYSIE